MFFLKKHDDSDILAVAEGEIVPTSSLSDPVFASEMMGKTVVIRPNAISQNIVSPANGVLEVLYPTGHAYAVRMTNGVSVLVHIGIDTVMLKGKGFSVKSKQGARVKAGQNLINVDFKFLKEKGYDISIMMIITENPNNIDINFIQNQLINSGDLIISN